MIQQVPTAVMHEYDGNAPDSGSSCWWLLRAPEQDDNSSYTRTFGFNFANVVQNTMFIANSGVSDKRNAVPEPNETQVQYWFRPGSSGLDT